MRKFVLGLFGIAGCSGGSQMPATAPTQPAFAFTVEEVFYIKPPVDRVILVGTITEGSVRIRDSLVVKCRGGDVSVVVDGIDTPTDGSQQANKGQQVGLTLTGIQKDQPARGDRVVR